MNYYLESFLNYPQQKLLKKVADNFYYDDMQNKLHYFCFVSRKIYGIGGFEKVEVVVCGGINSQNI